MHDQFVRVMITT